MDFYPTKLELAGDRGLNIEWNDGQRRSYTFRELRDYCPCATCREKRAHSADRPAPLLPIVTEAEMQPLRVVRMKPVGSYAYSIDFSDGHNTGIYTLDLLRELGTAI